MEPVSFELGLEFAADFADILSVKQHDFALGDPEAAKPLPPPVAARYDEQGEPVRARGLGGLLRTQMILSKRGRVDGSNVTYTVELDPRERWEVRLDVVPVADGGPLLPQSIGRRFGDERARVRDSLAAWQLRVPQLRSSWTELERSFGQSVSDLAALRMRSSDESSARQAPRRRDAVVHDRVRPRHADHVPADAAVRAGAGAQRARGARDAPGDRGRPVDRRGARQDRARGAARRAAENWFAATTAPSTRRRCT